VVDPSQGVAVGKIRVVLADDHQQMIAMVRQTLAMEFEVVALWKMASKPSMPFLR
jgi:hypothetical protein